MATLLLQILVEPAKMANLPLADWDRLICEANAVGLLARLHALSVARDQFHCLPDVVKPHLVAADKAAANEQLSMRWEVDRVDRALDMPFILLKGSAYLLSGLPTAKGRVSSDLDILVPQDCIAAVEKKLLEHGWEHIKLDDYDQYFYRHWSHELPPLQHRERGTVVDVHHTILPPTGRLRPDPKKLIAASLPLGDTKFRVLAPVDMVLHSAAHGFQDGDFKRPLRDLVDINGLLRHFGQDEKFWYDLGARAEELDLTRPLFYALRYAQRYLETPIAPELLSRTHCWQPAWPALRAMDTIVDQVVTAGPWRDDVSLKLAQQMLYIRSHWLRMPPHLLIPHLLRKLLRKRKEQGTG